MTLRLAETLVTCSTETLASDLGLQFLLCQFFLFLQMSVVASCTCLLHSSHSYTKIPLECSRFPLAEQRAGACSRGERGSLCSGGKHSMGTGQLCLGFHIPQATVSLAAAGK